ncbi:hypothetical protein Daus18300_002190 [Diaporthe australafricana]|uniref:Integral membrane protein n=1 Tax=Diaporthe australafricana TaxID=127596 RepID=A0ABR3XRR3_9PEZI
MIINLVELTPLTTLFGAATAESLILASSGAGGLPWAALSCFGSFFLAKACIAAALPSWLSESAGVNSAVTASILGASILLNKRSMLKVAPGETLGISVSLEEKPSVHNIYAFDKYTMGIIQSRLASQDDNSQHVFCYTWDKAGEVGAHDWVAIILSLVKLIETILLATQTTWQLSLVSTANWIFFFLSAVVLQALGISREHKEPPISQLRDIILGDFPTMDAGPTKPSIIMGVPANVRTHVAWRIVWAVGGAVSLASTVAVYVTLQGATARQFYLWLIFQSLWLFCRTAFHNVAVVTDGRKHPIIEVQARQYPGRLLSLCSAVSRHLAQRHPRTPSSYALDVHELADIRPLISQAKCQLDWYQPFNNPSAVCHHALATSHTIGETVTVEILAVAGDTVLSSLSWVYGCGLVNLDLYDSCVVIFRISGKIFVVPSGRVLSGNAANAKYQLQDAEAGFEPTFIPISGPCRGTNNAWAYWIPIGPNRWLHFIPDDLNFLGQQQAEILSDKEVTRRVALGTLWVSIEHVDDIKVYVERAAVIARVLLSELESLR